MQFAGHILNKLPKTDYEMRNLKLIKKSWNWKLNLKLISEIEIENWVICKKLLFWKDLHVLALGSCTRPIKVVGAFDCAQSRSTHNGVIEQV